MRDVIKGLFCAGVVAAVVAVAGCKGEEKGEKGVAARMAPLVDLRVVERGTVVEWASYTGSVEPVSVARLASPAEGPLLECNVREGDQVEAGQLLARVGRQRTAEAALKAAEEELVRQQADLERIERLVKSGALAGETLDAARSAVRQAEAQVAAMETGHDDYVIRAQWQGVVAKVWTSAGDYVAPRTPLIEIFDPESLVVRFAVPERDLAAVVTNMVVDVTLDAYPGRKFEGKITRLFPSLNQATRTGVAEAELPRDVRLWRGLFARISVPVRKVEGAAVVPTDALIVLPDGRRIVYVADEGNRVERREVGVVLESGREVAVDERLAVGERVVVRGQEGLKGGMEVRPSGRSGRGAGGAAPGAEAETEVGAEAEVGGGQS